MNTSTTERWTIVCCRWGASKADDHSLGFVDVPRQGNCPNLQRCISIDLSRPLRQHWRETATNESHIHRWTAAAKRNQQTCIMQTRLLHLNVPKIKSICNLHKVDSGIHCSVTPQSWHAPVCLVWWKNIAWIHLRYTIHYKWKHTGSCQRIERRP